MAEARVTRIYAGIDVGSTKTMFCVTGGSGEILLLERRSTAAYEAPGPFMAWLSGELAHLLRPSCGKGRMQHG
ncbi:ROK family protein [Paenibacillus sp. FSL R7-0297]|uniref:ROK family protein n=1 Tax=unclassified Paenibacillus TaxID=185978 RepID=UPI0004F659BC|nr:ROK family protein [Paenibacillus sp. FSL R5-0912]AIQ40011.1 hypothetical protein R50912_08185 [Paenibacillus sp. FSL R5-0912]